jgi:EmrB/QacA subfamily drug resistance transporter
MPKSPGFTGGQQDSAVGAWPRPEAVLAIVSTGVILSSLDLFVVNIALPRIGAGLHVSSLPDMSWLLNAYTIAFAALLVPAGRLADRRSRKQGFLLGVGIFTAASAACAAADNLPLLIAFRTVQGAGAALLTSTSLGLLLAAYPPARRPGAVRIWTAMGGVTAVFGPTLGGLLVQVSWRWIFLVNVPVGIAAIAAGASVLPDVPGERGPLPDVIGTLLLTGSVGATVLALVNSDRWHWNSAEVIGLLVGSAIGLLLFAVRSASHPNPVFEVQLLRVPQVAAALTSLLLFTTAFGAMILSLVLLAENTWGWSALRGGIAATPNAVLVLPASLVAGVMLARIRPGVVIVAGCWLYAIGIIWWRGGLSMHPAYLPNLLVGLVLTGVGAGLTMPTLFSVAASALPPHRFATGSGLVNMIRQLGIALGVAILVAVLATGSNGYVSIQALDRGWILIASLTAAAPLPTLWLRGRVRATSHQQSYKPTPRPSAHSAHSTST